MALLILQVKVLFAQNDSIKKLSFSGYGEIYYSYDFSNPTNQEKENFIYNHKLHNQLNSNLIVAKAKYFSKRMRANLGLMAGNYTQYNLKSEPAWAKYIYEANIGVKLSKNDNLWLDAGIMPSHIGFESAISADCWNLTRSILAENSPYYESGLKLSYINKKENLNVALLILNGWQRINRTDFNKKPSFGFQLNFKPTEKLTLNYSNFIGSEKPDSSNSLRTFHNIYMQYEPIGKLSFIAGFDFGTDKYNATDYGVWFSPVIILRYTLTDKMKIAFRSEYYHDKNQIVIPTNTVNGFQTLGVSTNFDLQLNNNIQFRIEGKLYHSKDKIFQNNTNNNFSLSTNLTFKI